MRRPPMEPRADGLERRPRRKRVASSSERTTSSTPTGRARRAWPSGRWSRA